MQDRQRRLSFRRMDLGETGGNLQSAKSTPGSRRIGVVHVRTSKNLRGIPSDGGGIWEGQGYLQLTGSETTNLSMKLCLEEVVSEPSIFSRNLTVIPSDGGRVWEGKGYLQLTGPETMNLRMKLCLEDGVFEPSRFATNLSGIPVDGGRLS